MTKHKYERTQLHKTRFYFLLLCLCIVSAVFLSGYAIGVWRLQDQWDAVRTSRAGRSGDEFIETEIAVLKATRLHSDYLLYHTKMVDIQDTQTAITFIQTTLTPKQD